MNREELLINSIRVSKQIGKILYNVRKVKLLSELSKGPLPKSKMAEIAGVRQPTITGYVKEFINAGIAEEYPIINSNGKPVWMVKAIYTTIRINLDDLHG